jgi:coenzyme F420-reducing hydrogenase delta subunit
MIYTKETQKIVKDFLDAIDLEIKRINTILYGDSEDVNLTERLNMLDDKIELIRIEHEMRLVLFNTRTHQ